MAFLVFPGCGLLFAEAGLGIHPDADFSALSRRGAVIIDFYVGKKADIGWIDFSVDLHGVSPYPLNELREILQDYQNYPGYFKRCLDVQIWETAEGSAIDFTLGVKILGSTSAIVFFSLATEPVNTEDIFGLIYSQRDDFAQIDSVMGEWYLHRIEIDGKPLTYCRFYGTGSIPIKHPLQEWFMTVFGPGEFRDMTNQLFRAVVRRNRTRLK
jgi:hypothetical protein